MGVCSFLHVSLICPTFVCVCVCVCVCMRAWSHLPANRPVRMNDGGRPSQTVESSPVNVGYLKTDGHLEAIGVQLEKLVTQPYTHTHTHTGPKIYILSAHITVERVDKGPHRSESGRH